MYIFRVGYNEAIGYSTETVQKQDPKWVILVIWYGTFMLEYLLAE